MDNNFNGQQPNGQQSDMNGQYTNTQYGQDMGAQYGYGQQSDAAQYGMNQNVGAYSDMNQNAGAYPDMNQNAGAYPDMNQNAVTYPNMNQNMGAYPDMNQNAGMNPQYGMNPQLASGDGKPPKVKKPMSKGKLAGIIVGGVVAAAAVICGVIFIPRLIKSDKEVVIDAFENTFASDSESDFTTDVLGYDDIRTAMSETGYTQKVEYSITGIGGLDTSGTVFSSDLNYDPVNKLISSAVDLSYNDNSFMAFNIFGDEDNTYIQLVDLIDGYFSIPNDLSQLAESPLYASDSTEDLSGLAIDYFPDTTEDDLNSNYVDAAEGLWDSVSVEKQGRVKIDVNGNTVKAKEYTVTLAEGDIESAVSSVLDGVSEIMLADPDALAEMGMDEDTFNESMQELKDMVPSLVNGDFTFNVYIADKKVVKIAASDKITLMYVDFNYDIYMDLDDSDASGKISVEAMGSEVGLKYDIKDIHDSANGTVTVYTPDDTVDLTFNVVKKDKESEFSATLSHNADELASMTGLYSFDEDTYDCGLSFDLNISGVGSCGMSMQSGYEDINKGVGYSVVSDISFTVNDETVFDMNGRGTIDTSTVSALQTDSGLQVYDLSTITSDELSNVIIDNYDNITAWSENATYNSGAIGELLGSLSSLIYGTGTSDDDYYLDEYDDSEYNDADVYDDTYTDEDMTLDDSNGHKVLILGCIDGFTLDYACSYFIDYYTDNYSYIEYTIESADSSEELLESFVEDNSLGVGEDVVNQPIEVDGQTIYYSMVYYDESGETPYYMFAKDLGDGAFLCCRATVYSGDSYTVEQLAGALSEQYYTVTE